MEFPACVSVHTPGSIEGGPVIVSQAEELLHGSRYLAVFPGTAAL